MIAAPSNHEQHSEWPAYWALLLASFLFLQSVVMALTIPRGAPPDELAHISYVMDVAQTGGFLPDYANGTIVNTTRPNYLKHPPLYYTTLGLTSRILGLDPLADYKYLRVLSAGMMFLGFLCWLLVARNMGVSLLASVVCTLACCAVPMFGYAAGSINNDSLAYLGAGLCLYGLSRTRLAPDSRDSIGFGLCAAGMLIAILTKATVAVFLVAFFLALLAFRWRDSLLLIRNRMAVKYLVAAVLPCAAYYAYVLFKFHKPFPIPGALYEHAPPAEPLDFLQYCGKFLAAMWERLPLILSHSNISPFYPGSRIFFYAMLVVPVVAWALLRFRAHKRGASPFNISLTDSFVVALVLTALAHVHTTYGSYLYNGLLSGWQPRYYAFALPGLWMLAFMLRPTLGVKAMTLSGFALFAGISFWASSPFVLAKQQAKEKSVAATGKTLRIPLALADRKKITLSYPVVAGPGNVDELALADGKLVVRGWAFDSAASLPVKRIWLLASGNYLGSTTVIAERPDVATALSEPKAVKSGFRIEVDQIAAPIRECEIQVLAEQHKGTVAILRDQSCP
jgi:hypothetical protein